MIFEKLESKHFKISIVEKIKLNTVNILALGNQYV